MREHIDIDELIRFASQPGATAAYVKEAMGLPHDTSWISKLMKRHVGPRPAKAVIERPNVLREAVVAYMEDHGLVKTYCSLCGRRGLSFAIHPLGPTLDDFVFVCERCKTYGDF